MKAKERQHLKEDELVRALTAVREFVDSRQRQLGIAAIVVLLIAAAIGGILILRQRMQAAGAELLAEAMVVLDAPVIPSTPADPNSPTPPAAAMAGTGTFTSEEAKLDAAVPKLRAAADAYPDSRPGITARYHLAGALAALGKHDEAITAYDEVIARAGDTLYGRMARLGKAEEQARAGQHDAAIATYTELAGQSESDLPADAILMQLARTYMAAGKTDDAQKTFTRIVDEHPDSPYANEARQELDALKG